MLCDRLVCGVKEPKIQRRLLAEPTLSFDKAFELALALESADKMLKIYSQHHYLLLIRCNVRIVTAVETRTEQQTVNSKQQSAVKKDI